MKLLTGFFRQRRKRNSSTEIPSTTVSQAHNTQASSNITSLTPHTISTTSVHVVTPPYTPTVTPPTSSLGGSTSTHALGRAVSSNYIDINAETLRAQIKHARIEDPRFRQRFIIPKSALDSLITISSVEKDILARDQTLEIADIKLISATVCSIARKLYAILVYIKKESEILLLLGDGVSDQDLPLKGKRDSNGNFTLQRMSEIPIKTLEKWSDEDIEEFDRIQWWMLAPVFEEGKHYDLDDNIILPFIPFASNPDTERKKEGGYSEVYPVRIHPSHHKFWAPSSSEDENPLVAVKKLFSSDKIEFQREVTILKALGSTQHLHMIKLLATYQQEGKYHLLFPCADENLRTYWETRALPHFNKATVLWSLEQMAGIASALSSIHNFVSTLSQKDTKSSGMISESLYGRHGDIKAENILWFPKSIDTDDNNDMGILKIADFGSGRFHGRDSRSRVPVDDIIGTFTYGPPEFSLNKPISRAYDIWSLGCLYLEFITWLLKGSQAIEEFSEFRGTGTHFIHEVDDDDFFTIVEVSKFEREAVVREEVVTWVNKLHQHDKCSFLMHDLLDLIMKEVLVIDTGKRSNAKWLSHILLGFLDNAKRDESYLLKPVPRQEIPGSDGHSRLTSAIVDPP